MSMLQSYLAVGSVFSTLYTILAVIQGDYLTLGVVIGGVIFTTMLGFLFNVNKDKSPQSKPQLNYAPPQYYYDPVTWKRVCFYEDEVATYLFLGDQKKADEIWDVAVNLNLPVNPARVEHIVYNM